MSSLQKSAPVLAASGIAVVAFGAAALGAIASATENGKKTSAPNCEAILMNKAKVPVTSNQYTECLFRQGFHYPLR